MANDINSLLDFIEDSPSPFHAVLTSTNKLTKAGFAELNLGDAWELQRGGKYFVNVYGSTLIAFTIGEAGPLRVAAAHTDFPCFRVKPLGGMVKDGCGVVNVEPDGGIIMRSWLDRPLGLAGKVVTCGSDVFHPTTRLVRSLIPLMTIPSLAIHMDRDVNSKGAVNAQKDMLPIAALMDGDADDEWWQNEVATLAGVSPNDLLSYELSTYPWERGTTLGFGDNLVSSPRLDNLTSVFACLSGLIDATKDVPDGVRLVALFDNEEVGSHTKQGAGSAALMEILRRIYACAATGEGDGEEKLMAALADGFLLSIDVAHAVHPNHADKSDPVVRPVLGGGVVIKQAVAQTYAGDAEAIAIVRALCEERNIDYQHFVNRSDSRGGSTLGSIASALVPVRTMDVGVPILAMHSARETMATADETSLIALARAVME